MKQTRIDVIKNKFLRLFNTKNADIISEIEDSLRNFKFTKLPD